MDVTNKAKLPAVTPAYAFLAGLLLAGLCWQVWQMPRQLAAVLHVVREIRGELGEALAAGLPGKGA